LLKYKKDKYYSLKTLKQMNDYLKIKKSSVYVKIKKGCKYI